MLRIPAIIGLLVLPPLLALAATGEPLGSYLGLPPGTAYRFQPPFSWPVFAVFASAAFAGIALLAAQWRCGRRYLRKHPSAPAQAPPTRALPAWGWLGITLIAGAWPLAWSRLDWFAPWQHHTFTPLWLGYIITVNALCVRLRGNSLLTARPGWFLALFPASAAFWWFFEYLNRFVRNWYYLGVEGLDAAEYAAFATISFSTVIPAVMSTAHLLGGVPALAIPLRHGHPLRPAHPRALAAAALLPLALGLAGVAVWPEALFPLVWIAPGLTVLAVETVLGRTTPLAALTAGNWQPVVLPAAGALVCGLLWELWNSASLAHWEYAIPFVDRFRLFEMPLLGYAGYLPFGIECLLIANLIPCRGAPDDERR